MSHHAPGTDPFRLAGVLSQLLPTPIDATSVWGGTTPTPVNNTTIGPARTPVPAEEAKRIKAGDRRRNVRKGLGVGSNAPSLIGDVSSGLLAGLDLAEGDYASAALNAAGLLPLVPAMGATVARVGRSSLPRPSWTLTRQEFEETGENLLHGTTKSFDQFGDVADRYGNAPRVAGRNYFTDDPVVANNFAHGNGAAFQEVNMNKIANDEYDVDFHELDPEEQGDILAKTKAAIQRRIDTGRRVDATDPTTGEQVPVTSLGHLTAEDFIDGNVRVWGQGRSPRVVQARVYGATLDLRPGADVPEEVVSALHVKGFDLPLREGSFGHEGSKGLTDVARDFGYGKIRVPDSYESGFQSIIALQDFVGYNRDAHRGIVVGAVKAGREVPAHVLAEYPDLVSAPGVIHGK